MSSDQGGTERLPPQSREAERSVLGSMLRDNGVIGDVLQIIRADNFYLDAHQKIFQAIVSLYDRGHPVDLVMLAELLKDQKQIEDIGNYGYLAELWDAAPTAANAEYYARIVRDKAIVRNLIHASTEILRDSYDGVAPADELLEGAERKILDIAQMGITGQTFTLEEALQQAYDRIDTRQQQDHMSISGLPTGFTDLNEKTAGLQNSELIIVAARPSAGKTAFAINIVRNIAVEEKLPVFFVSLEQSRIELAERLLCCQARVDSHKLRKGHLGSEDLEKLIAAGGVLSKAKLFIDDSPGQGMLRIAANARRLKLRHKIRLVVVDYLQLIEPDNRRDSRQEQVANISRRLKFLARELQIPVVALAQVNRSSEDRQDHKPRLADLRESGCLAGDTLVTLADTGARVPIRDLVGKSGFRIWALDEVSLKLKPAEVSHAFATGCKPVFRLETRLGRGIRATANHKFRTLSDWVRLDALRAGDRVAVPLHIPPRRSAPQNVGCDRLAHLAAVGSHDWLAALASRDVYWDEIVGITVDGQAEVFDLTVPGPSNFVAGGFIPHNSIEQDADTVMLLHRPEMYEPGQHEGTTEVIIAKQRNGPTGEITLTFLKQYMRFEDFAPGNPFGLDG
jgi:replicative DNA helicase